MCGIAAYTGKKQASPLLLKALKTLEYRGYDSAGLALADGGKIARCRVKGDLARLEKALVQKPLCGQAGIGHTRWATHGAPLERNAHPHSAGGVAIVHNGIIENHRALQAQLKAIPASDTDSEVIALQIAHFLKQGLAPPEAFRRTIAMLEGSFAIAAIFTTQPETLYAAQKASPLVIGRGTSGYYLASDVLALDKEAKQICFLEEQQIAIITPTKTKMFDFVGKPQPCHLKQREAEEASVSKGKHRHFMGKEIHEQPASLARAFSHYIKGNAVRGFDCCPSGTKQVRLIACGSGAYAARLAAYWLEHYARLPAQAEIASEFRYRAPVIPRDTLLVFISQSGETADTLAAMRYAKREGHACIALINRRQSTMAREADEVLLMEAGAEIGVGATKTLTSQIAVLAACVLHIATKRKAMKPAEQARHVEALLQVPRQFSAMLKRRDKIREVAHRLLAAKRKPPYVLYLGRGANYPIALEGALKLKEISYIQAEAYPAGEMKHGPLALVAKNVPVVAIAPEDDLFEKTLANLEEVKARGGKIILITGAKGRAQASHLNPAGLIILPDNPSPFARALLATLPVQLLAYETAHRLGLNVDRPRNLAKSVTVE